MVKLIMGDAGAGKTKQLIDLVHDEVETGNGSIVCIEPATDMMFDISHSVRLVDASEFGIDSLECLRGFISGLYAGNYDISHVFIDNLGKVSKDKDAHHSEIFLTWLDHFSETNQVKFTVTISQDVSWTTEKMKKYL